MTIIKVLLIGCLKVFVVVGVMELVVFALFVLFVVWKSFYEKKDKIRKTGERQSTSIDNERREYSQSTSDKEVY